jgi:hypothetical protein
MDEALVEQTVPIIMRHLSRFLGQEQGEREEGKIRRWLTSLEEPIHTTRSNWFFYEFQPTALYTKTKVRFWDGQELDLTPPEDLIDLI